MQNEIHQEWRRHVYGWVISGNEIYNEEENDLNEK